MKPSKILFLSLLWSPGSVQAGEPPLRVLLISGSAEYESDKSLAAFQALFQERFHASCTLIRARGFEELPGLEALDSCDVALFFTRRLTIDGEDLERVKRYCRSGKPIVAVRTASHGFQKWLEFDKVVLGGNYAGHCGPGLQTALAAPEAKGHPILDGVEKIRTRASLYKTSPLAEGATVLLAGSSTNCPETHPVAWTRTRDGARVFYTSLGSQDDFENSMFLRLLSNGIFWAAGRKPAPREPAAAAVAPAASRKPDGLISLRLRSRLEPFKGSGKIEEVHLEERFPASGTAILICDMWDQHWCRGASKRCEALAEKMAPVVSAAREKGVRIIHCPSETMDFYADWPQRKRMAAVPKIEPPKPLDLSDPPLPIDDSDGGCDTEEKPWYMAWTRESRTIEIGPEDAISESGPEVYSFLRAEGIGTLLVLGVHTNMCVLGRSFGIRQMTRWGIRCILVRDLTDTMYDPKDPPRVSHDEGTALVVEHIERYWCPSTTSEELLKGLP